MSFLIRHITEQINYELMKINENIKNKKKFLEKYGHLRSSTYDITIKNYKKVTENILAQLLKNKRAKKIKKKEKMDRQKIHIKKHQYSN